MRAIVDVWVGPLNEERHRHIVEVVIYTRHQEQPINGVIADTGRRHDALHLCDEGRCLRFANQILKVGMCDRESARKL